MRSFIDAFGSNSDFLSSSVSLFTFCKTLGCSSDFVALFDLIVGAAREVRMELM